jgi:hypothetical protein
MEWNMGKRAIASVAVLCCIIFCHDLVGESSEPLVKTVGSPLNGTQTWTIDNSSDNKVTFNESGGIGTTADDRPDSGTAVDVEFGEYGTEDKKDSLLTVTFSNDAGITTDLDDPAEIALANSEIESDSPNSPPDKIMAHIYAENTEADNAAVGINLAEGANLAIEGSEKDGGKYKPVMVAYSNVTSESDATSAAVTILAKNTNKITIDGPAFLTASATTKMSFSSSASAVIGAAVGSDTTVELKNLDVQLGDSNTLRASSSNPDSFSSPSASTVIGAAVGYASSVALKNLNVQLGNGNTLTASSSSSLSASAVVGAAVGYASSVALKT